MKQCSAHHVTFLSCKAKWQVRLIGHVMSNAIDNAKMHGLANGKICLYLDYNGTHFMLTLVNQPGENHQAALDRQAALGKGFMFSDLPQEVNLPGRTHSTFLVLLHQLFSVNCSP